MRIQPLFAPRKKTAAFLPSRRWSWRRAFVIVAIASLSIQAGAVLPDQDELLRARKWTAAKFESEGESAMAKPCLVVLASHDPVQLNNRNGESLKVGGKQYNRGIYTHAFSRILVRLPGPGKHFSAMAGIDQNPQTSGGQGSVAFTVAVSGKKAYQSDPVREGMPGLPVSIDLGGATEFTLEVGDGGDGISCDQSDWADAKATLADGQEVWLGDLPMTSVEAPFSFNYGDQPSALFLDRWPVKRSVKTLAGERTERTITFTDPATGLEARCVVVEHADFPTVEWTVYFKNTGREDSLILSDIESLDTWLARSAREEFLLHHAKGSPADGTDYQPLQTVLGPSAQARFAAAGGRPTNKDWAYFNIEWAGQGAIVAVGWPGQWAAEFARDASTGLRIRAGQELTRLKLHPGEEVRTPLMVIQFYDGDWIRGQNIWRRWMVAYNVPRPGGKLPQPQLNGFCGDYFPNLIIRNTDELTFLKRYLEEGIKLDYWWMDAGWYPNDGQGWPKVGTWEVDKTRFPNGLREISDYAHSQGIKTILWFEPERVAPGTWLANNHPEWVLGGKGGGLLNLGNPDALNWAIDHFDKFITDQGIDLYRQDFNMDPLAYWRANDAPDRQGITEIRHVEGYLAFWDALRERHPNMLIDSCASGGRRNDLETMRRAVPLHRSDFYYQPVGSQCITYGLALWLPFFGHCTHSTDPYGFRSLMQPSVLCTWDARRKDIDYDTVRKLIGQWKRIAPNYYGDYYPLTPYSQEPNVWIAWQFDRPETGEGVVQAFRRFSADDFLRFRLRGLDPEAKYTVTDLSANQPHVVLGRELIDPGLRVEIPSRPGAAIITYKKIQ
ncbi:MAG: alpha-galactosidase [Candidatus Omnitrophica bacterium]|nr:alpha-galactosidase [Candidatus Omnitrophota bacterium]